MKQFSLIVTDTTGEQHRTRWQDEPSKPEMEALHDLLRDFKTLTHLKVDTESDGSVYLNPHYVVSVRILSR